MEELTDVLPLVRTYIVARHKMCLNLTRSIGPSKLLHVNSCVATWKAGRPYVPARNCVNIHCRNEI
jgi:hypothetical protein